VENGEEELALEEVQYAWAMKRRMKSLCNHALKMTSNLSGRKQYASNAISTEKW
jgi:hypothetical protein